MKYAKQYQTHFCLEDRKIENINKIERLKYIMLYFKLMLNKLKIMKILF